MKVRIYLALQRSVDSSVNMKLHQCSVMHVGRRVDSQSCRQQPDVLNQQPALLVGKHGIKDKHLN